MRSGNRIFDRAKFWHTIQSQNYNADGILIFYMFFFYYYSHKFDYNYTFYIYTIYKEETQHNCIRIHSKIAREYVRHTTSMLLFIFSSLFTRIQNCHSYYIAGEYSYFARVRNNHNILSTTNESPYNSYCVRQHVYTDAFSNGTGAVAVTSCARTPSLLTE